MIGFDPIHCGRVIASARIAICHVFGVTNCSRSACGEMRLLARRFLGGPWFGALLAILTIGIVLPSTARAGCAAHYVNSRSPWNGEVAHLELLNFTGAIPAPAEETPGERPKPCSGALCSGNPVPPLSTMPSVPSLTGGQWALPVCLVSQLGSGVFQRLPAHTDVFPVDHSCSIFHPPRFQVI